MPTAPSVIGEPQSPDRTARRDEEQAEIAKHNVIYRRERAGRLVMAPKAWNRIDAPGPLTPYIRSMRMLGNVSGQRVLDAGCGSGWLSVILAKRGARVDGFDISPEATSTAALRAIANDVQDRCAFQAASFYCLPYADCSFDIVTGQSILHHVADKRLVAAELHRVMKPGGYAVFHEPFGNSLALEWLRRLVPVSSQAPEDPNEWKRQIKYRDVDQFRDLFEVHTVECELFSRLERVLPPGAIVDWLGRVDTALLRRIPWLRRYARSIILVMSRPA